MVNSPNAKLLNGTKKCFCGQSNKEKIISARISAWHELPARFLSACLVPFLFVKRRGLFLFSQMNCLLDLVTLKQTRRVVSCQYCHDPTVNQWKGILWRHKLVKSCMYTLSIYCTPVIKWNKIEAARQSHDNFHVYRECKRKKSPRIPIENTDGFAMFFNGPTNPFVLFTSDTEKQGRTGYYNSSLGIM